MFVLQQENLPPLPLSFFPVPCGALEPFLCFRLPQVRLNCENQRCGFGTALYTQAGGEQRPVSPHFPRPWSNASQLLVQLAVSRAPILAHEWAAGRAYAAALRQDKTPDVLYKLQHEMKLERQARPHPVGPSRLW